VPEPPAGARTKGPEPAGGAEYRGVLPARGGACTHAVAAAASVLAWLLIRPWLSMCGVLLLRLPEALTRSSHSVLTEAVAPTSAN
jgi:hypothetical protein